MTDEELRELDRQVAEHEGYVVAAWDSTAIQRRLRFVQEAAIRPGKFRWPHPKEVDLPLDLEGVPVYSTDWCAAGPLLEKYELDLIKFAWGWAVGDMDDYGDTPLIAICRAVLAISKE